MSRRKEKKMKATFVKTLAEIRKHNKKYRRGESWYRMTVNQFSVMDTEERRNYLGYLGVVNSTSQKTPETPKVTLLGGTRKSYPDAMSWKSRGFVTPSVNQGKSCLSCWTFPAVALLEFALKEATGKLVPLSAQQLLDCTYEEIKDVAGPHHDGCNGGRYQDAWEYLISTQYLTSQAEHPYRAADRRCKFRKYSNKLESSVKITGYKKVEATSDGVMAAVQLMPLAAAIRSEEGLWQYDRGIYDGCRRRHRAPDHAVLITGYGKTFWEVRNSWGPDWGISGFFKFVRGNSRSKMCFLLDHASYITYQNMNTQAETVSAVTSQSTTSPQYGRPCSNDESTEEASEEMETASQSSAMESADDQPGEKKVPEPTVDYNTKTTQSDAEETCSDHPEHRVLCEEWTKLPGDPCTFDIWREFMKYHCMRSCGRCSECKDKYTECTEWAEAGYCRTEDDVLWMKTNCVRSCGYC